MTDNEIIKALEYCKDKTGRVCFTCPLKDDMRCIETLSGLALNLIDRQKAEIEEHKRAFETILKEVRAARALYIEDIGKSRSEAIKEFAERLKKEAFDCDVSFGYGRECYTEAVTVIEIDRIAEEMTEETT